MGGAVEVSREQQILGMTGQPATEAQEFQYKYNIDSEDYNLYPDTPDVQESNEDIEEMEVFAEHVKKMQTKLAAERFCSFLYYSLHYSVCHPYLETDGRDCPSFSYGKIHSVHNTMSCQL